MPKKVSEFKAKVPEFKAKVLLYPTRNETRAVLRHRQASKGEQFKVMEALDTEKPSDFSEQECKALIEVLELWNMLSDMQQEAI